MIRKKIDNIEWLEFQLLAEHPKLVHAVFLRKGGVSLPSQYASLNALDKGDDPEHVQENRFRMRSILNLSHLVYSAPIHDIHLKQVIEPPLEEFYGYDALMTERPGIGLLITHADCQAAIFYDPIHHICANVHAGWRGQVKNIYNNVIATMGKIFGSKPQDLLVCISPSLGPEHAEFIHYQKELPKKFWQFQVKPHYFNLWEISRFQLQSCGILSHHIEIAEMDTFANSQDFFSYRREKKAGRTQNITGAHGTVVALRTR